MIQEDRDKNLEKTTGGEKKAGKNKQGLEGKSKRIRRR